MPAQDFAAAARRHHKDACLLKRSGCLANADQLSGYAAECAIKDVLLKHLGATCTNGARPKSPDPAGGKDIPHGHLPDLWTQLTVILNGRASSDYAQFVLGQPNPFAGWSIDDRYSDGTGSNAADVQRRITCAAGLLARMERSRLAGGLV